MRILHVTRELASDRRFGMGRSLDPVVAALQQAGHELRYLTQADLSPRAREHQRRWTERLLPIARWLFGAAGEAFVLVWIERLNMGRLAAKVAAGSQADAVHLHDPWMAWGFRLCRRLHRAGRCRWGLTEHGFGSYSQAILEEGIPYTRALLRLNRWLESSVLRAADWVVCPTRSARAQLARDMALPEPPAHWHAVPHARPELALPSRADARRQLGWAEGEWHILAMGRLNPVKRFDLCVRACLQTGRALQLTILGEGDAAPLRALLASAPDAPLTLDVRCVTDVAPYLAAADVYVCSTRNESFGLANLEAVAAGLPSICTAAGAVPEVIGACAWLIPAGDEQVAGAMAQALCALMDNPQMTRQMSAVGRRHGAAWPDAKSVALRYEAIYLGLA